MREAETVLVVDWPRREVPEGMVRAGLRVVVKGGPGPDDYNEWVAGDEGIGGEILRRPLGRAPEHVDAVYVYRPLAELAGIVEQARASGATEVWREPGASAQETAEARRIVEAAGLAYAEVGDALSRRARR